MSDARPVQLFASGPPETVLDAEPQDALDAIQWSLSLAPNERLAALNDVATRFPKCLAAWAALGDAIAADPWRLGEAYACYRVGYHRGLDRLRQNGWRGSGYVRWKHETNRGFLRSLAGLQRVAAGIGELDEAERCALFIEQLSPGGLHE